MNKHEVLDNLKSWSQGVTNPEQLSVTDALLLSILEELRAQSFVGGMSRDA